MNFTSNNFLLFSCCNENHTLGEEIVWDDVVVMRTVPWANPQLEVTPVSFLDPVIKVLIIAGKSVEVLRKLGRVDTTVEQGNILSECSFVVS